MDWALLLVTVGLVLALSGAFGRGGPLLWLGWIVLVGGLAMGVTQAFRHRRITRF